MEDLEVSEDTILFAPDQDGDVEICIDDGYQGNLARYVSFEKLEAWVALIKRAKESKVATDDSSCGFEQECGIGGDCDPECDLIK